MKKLKRLLSLMLTFVLVFSLSTTAFAEEGRTATIAYTASNTSPKVGDEFEVTAALTSNTGFNALDIQLTYDSTVLEFLGFETESAEGAEEKVLVSDLSGFMMTWNDAEVKIGMAASNDYTETGTIFVAKFKAIATGECSIGSSVDFFNMTSGNGDAVTATHDISAVKNLAVTEEYVVEEGYTVSLTPDTLGKVAGETAEVKIQVTSDEKIVFNSIYAKLTYDSSYLELATTSLDGYNLTDDNGTITIAGYGENKELGEVITLQFKVIQKPENGTDVTLMQANVDTSENADVQDAPEANYANKTATITVSQITVTYPETDFRGDGTVEIGKDYTFTAIDPNYDYTFTATMGTENVEVKDNKDGTYTVENVTEGLVIAIAEKTAKSFTVEVNGADDNQVVAEEKASYMTDYSFTVNTLEGYSTAVVITIDGEVYTGYSVDGTTYTIPGKDITGIINITVTNTVSEYTVSFEGSGAGDASAKNMSVNHGDDFTFTVTKAAGYTYTITAVEDDTEATVNENEDGTYTIEKVTGNLVITIEKTEVKTIEANVSEYVKLDGIAVYLVTAFDETLADGGALSYEGNVMYWSEKYDAYAYLVISEDVLTKEAISEKIATITEANISVIDYSGDINNTDAIDINDAQLVYDIYNAKYQSFEELSMLKFLRADANGSKVVDVTDAVAIVNTILGNE